LRDELEAKLLLGLPTSTLFEKPVGPNMEWSDFREHYSTLHLCTVRKSTAVHAESRLDLAEKIMKPKTLSDLADPHALQQLQAKFLAGAISRRKKPRSPHTVRGYINTVLAAINWAYLQGWLEKAPKLRKIKTAKLKMMKGRPISAREFESMLNAVETVVGVEASDSWKFTLRGLWESALRLDELMKMSWDIPGTIRPHWKTDQLPILEIPAALQKNDTEQSIPLLPWFEATLFETPQSDRASWIFNPKSLQLKFGRECLSIRPEPDWVGRIISRIGKKANVLVDPADDRTGRPDKFATAHDLRRSCGERLREAGVPPLVICRIMRHESWETTRKHYAPGNIQQDAAVLKEILGRRKNTEPGPSRES
jgi:integrase